MSGRDAVLLSFGRNLRNRRLALDWSQEELSRRSGLAVMGIAKLERGERRDPALSTLLRLVEAFDITLDELVCEAIPEHPTRKHGRRGACAAGAA